MKVYRGIIVKPRQADNVYVAWSTICEAPHFVGSRRKMLRKLPGGYGESIEDRLKRADATGTSSILGEGEYGDSLIFEQRGTIDCQRLDVFSRLVLKGNLLDALRMCQPWEDRPFPRGLGHLCDFVEPDGTTMGVCHLPGRHGGRCWHCGMTAAECAHRADPPKCDVHGCKMHQPLEFPVWGLV